MKYEKFKKAVEEIYNAKFPNSKVRVVDYRGFGDAILIHLQLAKTEDECPCNYWINDMLNIDFSIDLPKKFNWFSDDLPDELTLTCYHNAVKIQPESYSYLYYESRKVPFRKTTGDVGKILKTLVKFVDKLYDTIKDIIETNQVHRNFEDMLKDKIA